MRGSERRRVKPFRCAMMERKTEPGQMKGNRLMWAMEEQIKSKQRGPMRCPVCIKLLYVRKLATDPMLADKP